MPQNYQKKREKIAVPVEKLETAVEECRKGGSLRAIGKKYGIPKSTLADLLKSDGMTKHKQSVEKYGNVYSKSQVFTKAEEIMLVQHVLTLSKMHHGLSKQKLLELAFEFGRANGKTMPDSWTLNKKAGNAWWTGLKKRHPEISLRKAEATSLSRCTSFNKKNVDDFFDNLHKVMEKFKFTPNNIYNCDETAFTTVHKPGKVVAQKGSDAVGQVTSGERGVLVTGLCTVNAAGQTIPPFYVFPRVNFKDYMLQNVAIEGSAGVAHPSGWMTEDNFSIYLRHFHKYAKPSETQPVLLIFDNHSSHISIDVLNFAKENHIVLLTLPPHCSSKLQPLDVGVYGPVKKYYNNECDSWMLRNPGKVINIYQVAALSSNAINKACVPTTIQNAFKKTGIFPFDRNVFQEDDFFMSAVTNRPLPLDKEPSTSTSEPSASTSESCVSMSEPSMTISVPSVPTSVPSVSNTQPSSVISPEAICPFPQAAPRKSTKKGRQPAKTLVLTDTPTRDSTVQLLQHRNQLKRIKFNKNQKRLFPADIESEDDPDDPDSSSSDESNFQEEGSKEFKEKDYVLVECPTDKNVVVYVGKVVNIIEDVIEISFLRRKRQTYQFTFPAVPEIRQIRKEDIFGKLPLPKSQGTARTQCTLTFPRRYFLKVKDLR